MNNWKHKLAAWVHDPGEKPWILLRDRSGHEGGTVKALRSVLFEKDELKAIDPITKKADQWASAADRPQWPQSKEKRYADQVRFHINPVIIHPLTGESFNVSSLRDTDIGEIKADSFELFQSLIQRHKDQIDAKKTALAFWRFAQEKAPSNLGEFWKLAPADTRIPDHTIWQHLDLTSAFATAMAGDKHDTPALLTVSFGPVQGFIAQSRTTSDLWAGSHLLSRIAWQGLKVICNELGPDNVVFPQLRGLPEVDIWLEKEIELNEELFNNCAYKTKKTDENPIFSVAIPNRFVAIVPADQVQVIASKIEKTVKQWMQKQGRKALEMMAGKVDFNEDDANIRQQMERQFQDFPEMQWSSVSWELIRRTGSVGPLDVETLKQVIKDMTHAESKSFLDSEAWELLSKDVDGQAFFKPNEGVLYPALYDLLDRAQASVKTEKLFHQAIEKGFRCSLCGEREWLTENRGQLTQKTRKETLWDRLHQKQPSWAGENEHLCGICTIKRLWPQIVLQQAKNIVGVNKFSGRFVVSTHTMAMEADLVKLAKADMSLEDWSKVEEHDNTTSLPPRLSKQLYNQSERNKNIIRRLPDYIDTLDEDKKQGIYSQINKATDSSAKPEAYYGMILMDGDNMGAWLSGEDEQYTIPYQQSWHPKIKNLLTGEAIERYANTHRPVSPARHMAISSALNSFALDLVRIIVEDIYGGKLLYAGGDDVMAMLPVGDLLPAMVALRLLYSGMFPGDENRMREDFNELEYRDEVWKRTYFQDLAKNLWFRKGFVYQLKAKKLHRVMGSKATASCGAVIVHHTTPLSKVLTELRAAEHRAKQSGRDACSISVMKRAGGTSAFTSPWFRKTEAGEYKKLQDSPVGALLKLSDFIADGPLSRRAIYLLRDWMNQLPSEPYLDRDELKVMLQKNISYQLQQQSENKKTDKNHLNMLASLLTDCAFEQQIVKPKQYLHDLFIVSEFLARGNRLDKGENNEH